MSLTLTRAEAQTLTGNEMGQWFDECTLLFAEPNAVRSNTQCSGRCVTFCVHKCFRQPCITEGKQKRSWVASVFLGLHEFLGIIWSFFMNDVFNNSQVLYSQQQIHPDLLTAKVNGSFKS